MKAIELYFGHAVLFIMLYKVVPTCEYEGKILNNCDHSDESGCEACSSACVAVYYALQGLGI